MDTFEGFKIPKNAEKYKKGLKQSQSRECRAYFIDDITCCNTRCCDCIVYKYPSNTKAFEKWLSLETPVAQNNQSNATTRVLSYVIHPSDKTIFDENATVVKIEDEGAGEFIEISQCLDAGSQTIRINPEEWNDIKEAVENLLKNIS